MNRVPASPNGCQYSGAAQPRRVDLAAHPSASQNSAGRTRRRRRTPGTRRSVTRCDATANGFTYTLCRGDSLSNANARPGSVPISTSGRPGAAPTRPGPPAGAALGGVPAVRGQQRVLGEGVFQVGQQQVPGAAARAATPTRPRPPRPPASGRRRPSASRVTAASTAARYAVHLRHRRPADQPPRRPRVAAAGGLVVRVEQVVEPRVERRRSRGHRSPGRTSRRTMWCGPGATSAGWRRASTGVDNRPVRAVDRVRDRVRPDPAEPGARSSRGGTAASSPASAGGGVRCSPPTVGAAKRRTNKIGPERVELCRPPESRPAAGQESVWDYPRPPRLEPVAAPADGGV